MLMADGVRLSARRGRERALLDDGQQHVDVVAGQHARPPVRKIERT
jgi:hypothetical protein